MVQPRDGDGVANCEQQLRQVLALTGAWEARANNDFGNTIGPDREGPNRWVQSALKGTLCYLNRGNNPALLSDERKLVFEFMANAPATIAGLLETVRSLEEQLAAARKQGGSGPAVSPGIGRA